MAPLFTKPDQPELAFVQLMVTEADALAQRQAYDAIGDSAAWEAARANDVTAIVAHRLRELFGDEQVDLRWTEAHVASEYLLASYMAELDHIAGLLAANDIPMVALKNSGIARGIYRCIGCNPMGDMDVLVRKGDFRRAHRLLLEDGFNFEFRSPLEEATVEAAEEGGGAEYWKTLPTGENLWFELQWRPIAGRWIRPDQEPTAEELIGRSRELPGTKARLLSPEDNLLQVCLHTAKHSYVRSPGFRLNLDVDRISRYQDVDWTRFVQIVETAKVRTAVYLALAIPKELFASPVPDDVIRGLAPSGLKRRLLARWVKRAGIFNPDEKKFGRVEYILFTSLLYDDLWGFGQALFPAPSWMRERYGIRHRWLLPAYYLRRLAGLALRRTI